MACQECDPTLSPTGPRKGDSHFAIRFIKNGFIGDALMIVYKDGVQVKDVYEVEAPERAWRYVLVDGKPVLCGHCGKAPWAILDDSGGFSVAPAPDRSTPGEKS
jgi:hypothetical protein